MGEYLSQRVRAAAVLAPFQKLDVVLYPIDPKWKNNVSSELSVCEIDAFVPPELLRRDMPFRDLRRATAEALRIALRFLREDGRWYSSDLDDAVSGLDAGDSDELCVRLPKLSVQADGYAVDVDYRVSETRASVVAVVGDPVGARREVLVIESDSDHPIPPFDHLFPVALVRLKGGELRFFDRKKKLLKAVVIR